MRRIGHGSRIRFACRNRLSKTETSGGLPTSLPKRLRSVTASTARLQQSLSATLLSALAPSLAPSACCAAVRSEEHTSELQSLAYLVCRLLLETPTAQLYTLSLHDALPISNSVCVPKPSVEDGDVGRVADELAEAATLRHRFNCAPSAILVCDLAVSLGAFLGAFGLLCRR